MRPDEAFEKHMIRIGFPDGNHTMHRATWDACLRYVMEEAEQHEEWVCADHDREDAMVHMTKLREICSHVSSPAISDKPKEGP